MVDGNARLQRVCRVLWACTEEAGADLVLPACVLEVCEPRKGTC